MDGPMCIECYCPIDANGCGCIKSVGAIAELKKYFTSSNSIPVERATILAKDFWRIIGPVEEKASAGLLTFEDGYICAVANILRTHDEPTVAKDVLKQLGKIDPKKINPDDAEILRGAGLL